MRFLRGGWGGGVFLCPYSGGEINEDARACTISAEPNKIKIKISLKYGVGIGRCEGPGSVAGRGGVVGAGEETEGSYVFPFILEAGLLEMIILIISCRWVSVCVVGGRGPPLFVLMSKCIGYLN